jgi:hypothetical protein
MVKRFCDLRRFWTPLRHDPDRIKKGYQPVNHRRLSYLFRGNHDQPFYALISAGATRLSVAAVRGVQSSSRRSNPMMKNEIANLYYAAVAYAAAALCYGYDAFGDLLAFFSFTCATLLLVLTIINSHISKSYKRIQRHR